MYYIIYGSLYLVSLLPLRVLYLFGDFCYLLVFYVFKYRRDVVMNNLRIAFPEKTEKERLQIARKFYHNLIDTFIESIKFISISKKQLLRRSKGEFELLNGLIAKGYNIHVLAGHQFNWEFANLLYALNLSIPFVGLYMPISNKSLDKIFYNIRKRYGTILISAHEFTKKMHQVFTEQYMLALAADQNPGYPGNAFWVNFMGKPAPFVKGPSKGAVKHNTAVVYVGFYKVKRGHYMFRAKLLAENGASFTPEQLTILYKTELEKTIREDPPNYLWSHRRWKYEWKEEYGPILES